MSELFEESRFEAQDACEQACKTPGFPLQGILRALTLKGVLQRKQSERIMGDPLSSTLNLRTLKCMVKEEELQDISEVSDESYYSSEDEVDEESGPEDSDGPELERKVRLGQR